MSAALSVVIAVQHAQANLPAIVSALDCANHPEVEFLFCYTDADAETPRSVPALANVRSIKARHGSLIPHLWRDGIVAAHGEHVALSTAHCIPAEDWVVRLGQLDWAGLAGIGGVIDNHADSGARDWAIYLQRYVGFAPPQQARRLHEIAADNAVYRRDLIMQQTDLLEQGFWEPSYHARFRKAGLDLALDPDLRVTHRNRYAAGQFFGQRFAHGRAFGGERAASLSGLKRGLLVALSPLLPLLFLRKIVASARHNAYTRPRLWRAMPWLLFFLTGWGLGEARAYLESMVKK